MGSKFKVPVIFSTEWSIILFITFIVLAMLCQRKHKKGIEFGQVRMLPYEGLTYFFYAAALIAFIQLATHILAFFISGKL